MRGIRRHSCAPHPRRVQRRHSRGPHRRRARRYRRPGTPGRGRRRPGPGPARPSHAIRFQLRRSSKELCRIRGTGRGTRRRGMRGVPVGHRAVAHAGRQQLQDVAAIRATPRAPRSPRRRAPSSTASSIIRRVSKRNPKSFRRWWRPLEPSSAHTNQGTATPSPHSWRRTSATSLTCTARSVPGMMSSHPTRIC